MGLFYGNSLHAFLIVTLVLGGGAAWMSGRAVAISWGPLWQALAYMIPLSAAVRFLHYALAKGDLISLQYYFVTLVILAAIAALAFRVARTSLMARQYPWL